MAPRKKKKVDVETENQEMVETNETEDESSSSSFESVLERIAKASKNKHIDESGNYDSEPQWYIDTGSYSLNALISASIYKGFGNTRITTIAGEPTTGKTQLALSSVRQFLNQYEDAMVIWIDAEHTMTMDRLRGMKIDSDRVRILPIPTIEECRNQTMNILTEYEKLGKKGKLLIVIDSVGGLSSEKELNDALTGNNARDMTKSQLIKSLFRTLTTKSGVLGVPILAINHVFSVIGNNYPSKDMSGGLGIKFLSSTVVFLSKAKDKVESEGEKEQVGVFITAEAVKSRDSREGKKIKTYIHQINGLNRVYGLLPIAEKHKIFERVSKRIQVPSGEKVFESQLYKNASKYFDTETLNRIDSAVKIDFSYGAAASIEMADEIEANEEQE